MHEIIQTAQEDKAIGTQGVVIEDNFEVPIRGTDEEDPLQKEKEDKNDAMKLKEEVRF